MIRFNKDENRHKAFISVVRDGSLVKDEKKIVYKFMRYCIILPLFYNNSNYKMDNCRHI